MFYVSDNVKAKNARKVTSAVHAAHWVELECTAVCLLWVWSVERLGDRAERG